MNNKFFIENENNEKKEASIITMLGIEDRKYLIYSVDSNNDSALVCASKVIKTESGEDKLVDIEEGEDKEKIKEFINSLSNK